MKDAKGHGSNAHNAGIAALGQTRYHFTKRAYWEEAQKKGYLDPSKYSTGMIWTSTHPDEWYAGRESDHKFSSLQKDEVELALTIPARNILPTPGNKGGGSADRVTRVKIPVKNITEIPRTLPTLDEYRKQRQGS